MKQIEYQKKVIREEYVTDNYGENVDLLKLSKRKQIRMPLHKKKQESNQVKL